MSEISFLGTKRVYNIFVVRHVTSGSVPYYNTPETGSCTGAILQEARRWEQLPGTYRYLCKNVRDTSDKHKYRGSCIAGITIWYAKNKKYMKNTRGIWNTLWAAYYNRMHAAAWLSLPQLTNLLNSQQGWCTHTWSLDRPALCMVLRERGDRQQNGW